MRILYGSLITASFIAMTHLANASLIDFQRESLGTYADNSTTLLVDGINVRFSGLGLNIRDLGSTFPSGSSRVLSTIGDSEVITMELLGGAITNKLTFHNWISGVYTNEVDSIFAQAFDASNNLLGSITSSNEFVALNFNGMARITFDDRMGNDGSDGYVLDELRYTVVAVPEPSTWALMIAGLAALTFVHRRTRGTHE